LVRPLHIVLGIAIVVVFGAAAFVQVTSVRLPWLSGAHQQRAVRTSLPPPSLAVPPPPRSIPSTSWATPTPPYNNGEAHPIALAAIDKAAVDAALPRVPAIDGPFLVTSAWYLNASLQVAVGDFRGTGVPEAILLSPGGGARTIPLLIDGAPGPAYIEAVKGPEILLLQGYGYEVLNDQTGRVSLSNQNGKPVH
jgi:hypothetical protein